MTKKRSRSERRQSRQTEPSSKPADEPRSGFIRGLGRALTWPLRPFPALWQQPRKTALTLASALAIVLAFPPYEVVPLVFVAWVPLLLAIDGVAPRAAFGWGLLAGATLTGLGFYFMVPMLEIFGGLPKWFAFVLHLLFSLYHGLGIALFAALTAWLRRRGGWPLAALAPATYVAAEMLAREVFIFPWYLGNATYPFTTFIQSADLFGGFGLTALLALINGVLADLVIAWRARGDESRPGLPVRGLAVAAVLLAANLTYGVVRIAVVDELASERPHVRLGLVEANIGPLEKRDPELGYNNMLIHQHLSAQLERDDVDLIIWPETSAYAAGYTISTEPTDDLDALEATTEVVNFVPRDVTYFRPSTAPLVANFRQDRDQRTPDEDVHTIQRGFHTPLLFGVLTVREPTDEEARAIPPEGTGRR